MMTTNKELTEFTLEELFAEKKKRKALLTGFGIVMLIACGILVFLAAESSNFALLAVPCGCFLTLMPSIVYMNQVEKEIKSRAKI